MDALSMLFGIGITIFLLLYIAFNLDERHFILKFLILFFCIGMLLLIPRVAVEEKNHCAYLMVNSTDSPPDTFYSYQYLCDTNAGTTPTTFYKSVIWFLRLFITYASCYFVYEVLKWFNIIVPKEQ